MRLDTYRYMLKMCLFSDQILMVQTTCYTGLQMWNCKAFVHAEFLMSHGTGCPIVQDGDINRYIYTYILHTIYFQNSVNIFLSLCVPLVFKSDFHDGDLSWQYPSEVKAGAFKQAPCWCIPPEIASGHHGSVPNLMTANMPSA